MKEKLINEIMTQCFNKEDATEIVDIILKLEGENIKDIVSMWEDCGARWDDEEVVEYVNMGEAEEDKLSLNEIMAWDNFFRLKSGLIISWKY